MLKAEDTRLKRAVALKFLPLGLTQDRDAKQRLLHEAQAASALDHPNICTIYEIEETPEGRLFVAMAYERRLDTPLAGPNALRDLTIQQVRDLRRSIDYLEAREDVDPDRLAYLGVSFGARLASISWRWRRASRRPSCGRAAST